MEALRRHAARARWDVLREVRMTTRCGTRRRDLAAIAGTGARRVAGRLVSRSAHGAERVLVTRRHMLGLVCACVCWSGINQPHTSPPFPLSSGAKGAKNPFSSSSKMPLTLPFFFPPDSCLAWAWLCSRSGVVQHAHPALSAFFFLLFFPNLHSSSSYYYY